MASRSQSAVSSANAAATVTVTGAAGQICRLYRLDAFTSAGTSTVTVSDGATVIWRSASGEATTSRLAVTWTRPLEGQPGNTMTVTGSAAGASNTVTVNAQIEQSGA